MSQQAELMRLVKKGDATIVYNKLVCCLLFWEGFRSPDGLHHSILYKDFAVKENGIDIGAIASP
jgi:hypothetical protein